MSVRKLTFLLLAAAALFVGQRQVNAQEYLPVTDPFRFDPDFKWFEPVYEADLVDMKPSKRASTGWYGTYDRMHLYFSRPEIDRLQEGASSDHFDGFDRGWGNRIRVGYMLEENHGWSSTWFNISGPNAAETLLVERLNRLNTEDLAGPPVDDGNGGGGGTTDGNFDRFGQLLPSADRNYPFLNERVYELKDSINIMDASSFEINKTWRMEPYHYGGILEPMIGLRYVGLEDYWMEESYTRDEILFTETLIADTARTKNTAFGGQLGARYFKHKNRLTFSGEFRAFALQNWQSHRASVYQIFTEYDGLGLDSAVVAENASVAGVTYRDNQEVLIGYDVRAEVAYQLTRMFQIRGGFQLIDLSRGIWRGEIQNPTDQGVMMVGSTFGVALNY